MQFGGRRLMLKVGKLSSGLTPWRYHAAKIIDTFISHNLYQVYIPRRVYLPIIAK